MTNEDKEIKEAVSGVKKFILWFIAAGLIISAITFTCNRAVRTVDNGIIRYEEFQELYNTCQKINTDLCNMNDVPETDPMFAQFSKAQRIVQMKTNLNRWVEDYNAKSKMFNHSLWKSSALPYELNVYQFGCYTPNK